MMWAAVIAAGAIAATLAIIAALRHFERQCPACKLWFPCADDMHHHLERRHLS